MADIERAAARTWPASTVEHRAGWVLRHCPRLNRRRSNSALPPARLADPATGVDELVRFYGERDSRALVQVSPLGTPNWTSTWRGAVSRSPRRCR